MCGVPVHAADAYLSRLIRKGFRVAICEQMEDPAEARKRGGKSVVKRDVVRLVTPGTLTEERCSMRAPHNFLAALADGRAATWRLPGSTCRPATSWPSRSPGRGTRSPPRSRGIDPGECWCPESLLSAGRGCEPSCRVGASASRRCPTAAFDSDNARRRLEALYGVGALDGFGDFARAELAAAGALVDYVELTQVGKLPRLRPAATAVGRRGDGDRCGDAAQPRAVRSLSRRAQGQPARHASTAPSTGAGARLLAAAAGGAADRSGARSTRGSMRSASSSTTARLRAGLRDALRALSRHRAGALAPHASGAAGRATWPRIRDGLAQAAALRVLLAEARMPAAARRRRRRGRARRTRRAGRPADARAGRRSAAASPRRRLHRPRLCRRARRTRELRDESRRLIADLERATASETGVASLKIRHNNVLGYFIEVTPAHRRHADGGDSGFIHRQTMATPCATPRRISRDLARRIAEAADKALALELQLFDDLVGEVSARGRCRRRSPPRARRRSTSPRRWPSSPPSGALRAARPSTASRDFRIARRPPSGGRGGAAARRATAPSSPTTATSDEDARLWLVTGPNMAGKAPSCARTR